MAAAMPSDDETTLPASNSFTDSDPLLIREQTEVYQIRRRIPAQHSRASYAPLPISADHQAFLGKSRKRLTRLENDLSPKRGSHAWPPLPRRTLASERHRQPEGRRLREEGDHLWPQSNGEDRLAAGLRQGLDTRRPLAAAAGAGAASLPLRLRTLRARKAKVKTSRRRGRPVSSPTRFPRREKSSGRAAATAASSPAPSSATS